MQYCLCSDRAIYKRGMYKSRVAIEYIIYLLFWGALFLSPFWGFILAGSASQVEWSNVYRFWIYLLPALILFYVNNNLLMPFLLMNKKRERHYLLYLICIIALAYLGSLIITSTRDVGNVPSHKRTARMMDRPGGRMPHREAPRMQVYATYTEAQQTIHSFFVENDAYNVKLSPPARGKNMPFAFLHPDNVQILLIVFVLAFNICVRLFFLTLRNDEHLREVEKEKLRTELDYLKYQINPHFFMNTLNNIHALIDIDSVKAQEAVIGLSKMMRHVLYDAHSAFVPLEKEIEFLNSYTELMRLRYTAALKVTTSFPPDVEGCFVPSLLFVSFLENAFKHGVAYNKESSISVSIVIDDDKICFNCFNSCVGNEAAKSDTQSHGGIGIDNVRKRLSLIYGESYSLEIEKKKSSFNVILKIPVRYDKVYNS